LSSCAGEEEKELEPTKLVKIETKVNVKRLWSSKIGDGAEFLLVALRPASDGNRLYAASRNGNVVALDPATGKAVWRTELEMDLSAGPGVGEGLIVVGAADGILIALDADSGAELWRANLTGETLARPVIKDGMVVTMTIDNRLRAVSAFDGAERWTVEQATPTLTMRGSASPVLVGTTVVAGFDNGRLVAVNIATGNTEWEAMLSPPTGRSDLGSSRSQPSPGRCSGRAKCHRLKVSRPTGTTFTRSMKRASLSRSRVVRVTRAGARTL
jgi:outer membrane protein assembly factor BamB